MERSTSSGSPAESSPRGFVATNEREQIIVAVAKVVSVAGYGAMTLEDVAVHADVPLETVQRHFADEESAYVAAYETAVWQGIERVLEAHGTTEGFSARLWAGWLAFVDFIVAEPAFASMCIVDSLAAGDAGLERRGMALRGLEALVQQVADESLPADHPRPPELYLRIAVGGFAELFREHLASGRVAELRDALPGMHYTLILPYLGHDAALEEFEERSRALR
jgi:AcrR family transcriptional regulator